MKENFQNCCNEERENRAHLCNPSRLMCQTCYAFRAQQHARSETAFHKYY